MASEKLKAAIIGSGNIGTDLMIKIMRNSQHLQVAAMVGIDAASDGLARAARLGVATTHEGVEGLTRLPVFDDIDFVFDATSAGAHVKNDAFLRALKPGIRLIDLTPAAIGPYCVPVVNLDEHLDALNVNMVTCGGQATIQWSRPCRVWPRSTMRRSSRRSAASPPVPARARISTNSRKPPRRPSKRSAARREARPSSCSIRPSRR
jgi:acetaldehyde dehydrogenase (acetylating)